MNRLLLFLCCICVPWMARGQAAYDWYYWFDQGHTSYVSGQSIGDRFTIETDAQGLSDGIHTIHVQVADTAGKYSPPLAHLFYHTNDCTINRIHYWFDNEVMLKHSITLPQNNAAIDVSQLKTGLHFIYFQVEDAAGLQSDVTCRAFYRQPMNSDVKWSYWFDDNEQSHATVSLPNEVVMVDVSGLDEGFHVMHNQVYDDTFFDITTTMFFKVPQTEGVGNMTCICIVDGNIVANETLPTSGGMVKWDMDVDKMDLGIHKAMFQVITPSGAASSVAERYFVRAITNKELGNMKCVYTIDNFETYYEAGTLSNGLFHFDLDVASLEDGLHRIAYTLVSETGVTLPQQTAFFWKTPLGGEGIVQYDYWVNNNDDQKHSVQLDKRTNPFSLITLLPVETQPIRSSNFHFAVKNGEPLIYARNEFHIQFYDTNGRMVEGTKEYYDEQVTGDVNPVGELQATQTFPKVADNDILWYTMQAAPGDSVTFKLSQAGTIQVFAPSGKEVFKTSESASVQWGGIHTWEDGIYYLAVHDVTGSKADMKLDYMHMDKYDVVDWDVHTVGNGGCSTITFEGNGFDELKDICLVLGHDSIHAEEINSEGKATTKVKFNFDGVSLGQYKAVFTFEDGLLYKDNCVTVEEATPIELAVEADFARQYLISFHKTKYVFSIHNYGNVTAYNVPLRISIYTHTGESLEKVQVQGFNLYEDFKSYMGELYSDTLDMEIKKIMHDYGDRYFFVESDSTDIKGGWAAHKHEAFVLPSISPNSTLYITVNLELGQAVFCYLQSPIHWSNNSTTSSSSKMSRKNAPWFLGDGLASDAYNKLENHYNELNNAINDIEGYVNSGGQSNPGGGNDPNDILGYTAESGSHAIKDGEDKVYYAIEFENDPELATAPAHEIFVTDTLDATKFDLSTYAPTRVRIGEKSAELNGDKNFVTTIDMRPEINAIAQVEGTFDQKKGIAKWHISSLDPMTMEPTDDVMQGVLPVNNHGNGIGELSFDISLKPNLTDGTEINNRACIVFDKNAPILTPTWVNIVDAVAPVSRITEAEQVAGDSLLTLRWTGEDERSGIWHYDVYAQMGAGSSWELVAEHVTGNECRVRVYEDIEYGFCVVATDMAGNREKKAMVNELLPDTPDDIDTPEDNTSGTDAARYDLLGRKTDGSRTGVYIQNGQLIFVRH